MPLISVILSVYNQSAACLKRCFHSVLDQFDPAQSELIIVDDGSEKAVADYCDRYASLYPHCKVYHEKNIGVSTARNVGLSKASGDFVMILDADDRFAPGTYEALLPYLKQSTDLILFNTINIKDGIQTPSEMFDLPDGTLLDGDDRKDLLLNIISNGYKKAQAGSGMQTVWAKAYNRKVLDRYGMRFNCKLKVAEDICFFGGFVKRCEGGIYYLNRHLYCRYKNKKSLMNKYLPDILNNDGSFIADLRKTVSGVPSLSESEIECAMRKRYVLCVFGICRYYLCHAQNGMSLSQRAEALRRVISAQPYREGIRKARLRWFGKRNALKLLLLKLHMEKSMIRFLC